MSKKPLQLYFDTRNGHYWLELERRFLPLDASCAKLHLRRSGLSKDAFDSSGLNELERAMIVAQLERHVDYSGPLAGHKLGIFSTTADMRVLVTTEARPPVAKRGKHDHLERLLSELFKDQVEVAMSWLKVARESQLAGDFRPGQLLVLAGPPGCGKSLFQSLVTEWLGGRVAKPFRYFIGETPFNGDLAGAEHLMIEDENASTDIRRRRDFGGRIKEYCASRDMNIHPKGRQAMTLPTFRRLTLSVNDEPENLMILPPLDDSLADKITLLKCSAATIGSDRDKTWRTLTGELAALAWTLERWSIPHRLRCSRYGVKAWQHPELFEALSDLSPERRLMDLIDQCLFETGDFGELHFSSEELESKLRQTSFGFSVERLLHFPGACGTYLARLVKTGRVRKSMVRGRNRWLISAPDKIAPQT